MACDTAALIEQAKCLETCIPNGMMGSVQLAVLCNLSASISSPLTSTTGGMVILTDDAANDFAYSLEFRKRGNTVSVSGAVANGAEIGIIGFLGWDGSAYAETAEIVVKTDEAYTPTNHGGHIELRTSALGATTPGTRLTIGPSAINIASTSSLQLDGVAYHNPLSVYATGTVYTLTAVSAAVDFGTTDPILTINAAGTYRLRARVKVALNGATFAANRTLTVKLRRTNNTPADVANSSTTWIVPIITTITNTLAIFELPEASYVTVNTTDTVTLFADISVLPTAGSISIDEACIIAERLS